MSYTVNPVIQQDVLDELAVQVPGQLYLKSKQRIGSHMFALAMLGYRGPTLTEEELGFEKILAERNVYHRIYREREGSGIIAVGRNLDDIDRSLYFLLQKEEGNGTISYETR